MKHLKQYTDYTKTNEFLNVFKKKTDEEKFENALNKAKPIIKHNYENVFDEERKRKFYQFVKNNGFTIPEYFKFVNGQFVDASIAIGSDITSINTTKANNNILQENKKRINENTTTCFKIGDLIFNKDTGNNGLCGLVVSDCMGDEDGHYHEVYYRGWNGDIFDTHMYEMEAITFDNIDILDNKNDIPAYESICKRKGITLNPKYRAMLDEYNSEDEYVEDVMESKKPKCDYEECDYEDARSAIEGEFSDEKIEASYTKSEVEKLANIVSKLRKKGIKGTDVWENDKVSDYLVNLSAKYKNKKKSKIDKNTEIKKK